MTDIDAEVAAFAAEIERTRVVDEDRFEFDVFTLAARLLSADRQKENRGAVGLFLVELRDKDLAYAQLIAVECSRRLAAHLCLHVPNWEIASCVNRLSLLAFTCRAVGLTKGDG